VPYGDVADVIEDIVEAHLALRARPDELFVDTVKRLGVNLSGAGLCHSLRTENYRRPFVHVPDGAELPGDGPILIPAARFLEIPTILQHSGKVGVIWPNNRDLTISCPISTGWPRWRWCFPRSATAAPIARHGAAGTSRV
jgi:hypothetical protein